VEIGDREKNRKKKKKKKKQLSAQGVAEQSRQVFAQTATKENLRRRK
jgi:hypothetical protein